MREVRGPKSGELALREAVLCRAGLSWSEGRENKN